VEVGCVFYLQVETEVDGEHDEYEVKGIHDDGTKICMSINFTKCIWIRKVGSLTKKTFILNSLRECYDFRSEK
jgi:hypothetical protein